MLYQLIDMMIKQNFLNNIYFGVHFINPIMDLSWKVRQDIVLEPVKVLLVRDYCGNYEYENCRLVRIHTENGYIDGNGIYNAYIKDYQGNNRVTVSHTGQYFDVTNYYPYGMPYADLNGYDRYKYSGKEIETANGLNHYDFHARSHDFALGQFTGQDKKAVDYASVSPYTYCAADPVNNIDPTGEDCLITIDGNEINIYANIFIYGQYATDDLAKIYKKGIDETWGTITSYTDYLGKKYTVNWNVNVEAFPNYNPKNMDFNGINNYFKVFRVKNEKYKDVFSYVLKSNQGEIRSKGMYGGNIKKDNPMPHEFGHILGLSDKYVTEGDNYGKPVSPEWEGNIMAESAGEGTVSKMNMDILMLRSIIFNNHITPLIERFVPGYLLKSYRNDSNKEK